jgi:hypothetical protein
VVSEQLETMSQNGVVAAVGPSVVVIEACSDWSDIL